MKTISELTELEAQKLLSAQLDLKHAALAYAMNMSERRGIPGLPYVSDFQNDLFRAARYFDRICQEVGFEDYWQQEAP